MQASLLRAHHEESRPPLGQSTDCARSCSGSLDMRSARSLLKADSVNAHCSLDSKRRSLKTQGMLLTGFSQSGIARELSRPCICNDGKTCDVLQTASKGARILRARGLG